MNRHQFEQAARMFRAGRLTLADFSKQFVGVLATANPSDTSSDAAQALAETLSQTVFDTEEVSDNAFAKNTVESWANPGMIHAQGKTIKAIRQAIQQRLELGQPVLVTLIEDAEGRSLCEQFPAGVYNAMARTLRIDLSKQTPMGLVTVVTAGTLDLPIAEEALETLRWMGIGCVLLPDFAVDELTWKNKSDSWHHSDAIVAVAGWDVSLPNLIASRVNKIVIALPVTLGPKVGSAGLVSALNCRAANCVAVNCDDGFRAGYVAGQISRIKRNSNESNRGQ